MIDAECVVILVTMTVWECDVFVMCDVESCVFVMNDVELCVSDIRVM